MLGGITYTPGLTVSEFTVTTAGVYRVSFGLVAEDPNQFNILVDNGDPVSGALVFGDFADENTEGTAVLHLDALDTISLGNLTSTGDGDGNVL